MKEWFKKNEKDICDGLDFLILGAATISGLYGDTGLAIAGIAVYLTSRRVSSVSKRKQKENNG